MKYVCFGYYDKDKFDGMTEAERNAMFDTCFEYDDHPRTNGHWAGGEALRPGETALSLHWRNVKVLTTDGPFAETKEQLGGIFVLDADRRDARHSPERLRAEERRHALAKFRMVRKVEMRLGGELAAEAVEPILDVGRVADLAGLAVADDVEPDIGLALDNIRNRAPHHAIELGLVIGFAAVLAEQQRDRVVRPRQAADVGGENSIGTVFHDFS